MNLKQCLALTQELIAARGPVGQEDEVRALMQREYKKVCDEVWVDAADNVVGLIRGRSGARGKAKARAEDPAIRVMAHMDELSLIVKRVEADGRLRVRPLGGIFPWSFGLGPVDILSGKGPLPGVLSVGPLHTTAESPASWSAKPAGGNQALDWPQVHVFTRQTKAALTAAGVQPGTRVVVAQSRRALVTIGDCVGGYFLDDRVCLTIQVAAAAELRARKTRPAVDVYLVAGCEEEIGGGAAAHAARTLPGSTVIAVDVGPTAAEYGTELNTSPMVVYRDRIGVYTRAIADHLMALGRKLRLNPQAALWESYGSDASCAKQAGNTAKSALLCIPTENTHGFEVVPTGAILPCAELLAAYLRDPA